MAATNDGMVIEVGSTGDGRTVSLLTKGKTGHSVLVEFDPQQAWVLKCSLEAACLKARGRRREIKDRAKMAARSAGTDVLSTAAITRAAAEAEHDAN